MNKSLAFLLAASALSLVACTEEQKATNMPPGKYESMKSSTDANGTTTEQKNSTEVTVDKYGNKTAVVKSKTTQDPKGLMNKTTTNKSTTVIEEK